MEKLILLGFKEIVKFMLCWAPGTQPFLYF